MKSSPILSLYLQKKMLILAGLGFSSGLPLALTGSTLQAWLVSTHVDIRLIGILSLVTLPYSIKVFWSPIMDRFIPPFLGRRRGWIIICQLVLGGSTIFMGLLNPSQFLIALGMVAFWIAFLSASQDIAIDAYRTDVLEEKEQGAGAATSVLGYRIAMLVSGAFAMILSDYIPWSIVYIIMGFLIFVCSVFTIFAPEPPQVSSVPQSLKEAVVYPLKNYFSRSRSIETILFIISFKLGDALASTMTTPFLLDLGFSRSEVGIIYKTLGLMTTILGALLGGAITARIGLLRSLWIFAALQAISNFSFVALASVGKNYILLVLSVAIENMTGGMGTAGFIAFLMSLCDRRFTATQYALLSSLMAVTRIIAGTPTGFMVAHLGWVRYFAVTVIGALPAIMLLPKVAPWNSSAK